MSNPTGTVSQVIPGTTTGAEAPPAVQQTNRPAWLPEKFKTPEDFAKSYSELETKLGSKAAVTEATQATQQTTTATTTATDLPKLGDPVKAVTTPAVTTPVKADISKFEKEFSETGKFSDASYAELEAIGINRAMVDQYAQGVQAHQAQTRQEIFSTVGGEPQFQQVMQWSATNLSEPEKAAYNSAVNSGNVAAIKLAVAGMNARFQQTYGREPSLLGGKAPSQSGPAAFSSWAQVTAAMSDKRYDNDPSYRAEVESRIAVSKNL